jgi:hypothetical protein
MNLWRGDVFVSVIPFQNSWENFISITDQVKSISVFNQAQIYISTFPDRTSSVQRRVLGLVLERRMILITTWTLLLLT